MKTSQQITQQANILPKLRLGVKTDKGVQPTGPHRVKFLQDKEVDGVDSRTGQPVKLVAYLVEENGVKKSYRVSKFAKDKNGRQTDEIHYLVQRLAEVDEGEEVIMEMKKQGIKNYVQITPLKGTSSAPYEEDDDIPVINEDEQISAPEANIPVEGEE